MTTAQMRTATTMQLLVRFGDLVPVLTAASLRERNAITAELERRG